MDEQRHSGRGYSSYDGLATASRVTYVSMSIHPESQPCSVLRWCRCSHQTPCLGNEARGLPGRREGIFLLDGFIDVNSSGPPPTKAACAAGLYIDTGGGGNEDASGMPRFGTSVMYAGHARHGVAHSGGGTPHM